MQPLRHHRLSIAALMLAILALTAWAYLPGLSGGFLFDDFANLPVLGDYGPVDNAGTFWRYITSGTADTTGRPVALLSFLIDAQNWPADPWPFKRTNVLLHLLNGILLAWFLARLGHYFRTDGDSSSNIPTAGSAPRSWRSTDLAAVLAASIWMLHPLFVSTTLYIVQREAMLPATFVLIGLLGFCSARERVAIGHRSGLFAATLWLGFCTILATLSKGNGSLLPLLAWLIDALFLAPRRPVLHPSTSAWWRRLRWALLIVPSLLVLAWLAYTAWKGFAQGLESFRPWTLSERLLTQNRVVADYLRQLWMPAPYSVGLFNDSVVVSSGWLSPATTLLSAVFLAVLICTALVWRNRYPALSLSILFYFTAQLMESTVVPLEMYFEHRNYLPAMLLFWPLALWLCRFQRPLRQIRIGLAVVLPIGLAILTHMGSSLWGNVEEQGLLWALRNPASPRAQANAAQIEMAKGRAQDAVQRLTRALQRNPEEIQLALNLLGAKCQTGTLDRADIDRADLALRTTRNVGRLGFEWFERGLDTVRAQSCSGLDMVTLERLLAAAEANPNSMAVPGRRQDLHNLRARIALSREDGEAALKQFNAALDARPTPHAGLAQAAQLGSRGYPRLALRHLDYLQSTWHKDDWRGYSMESLHQWLLTRQGYWDQEIRHLRGVLEDDLNHLPTKS